MCFELPPGVAHEQAFCQPEIPGAGQFGGNVPRRPTPGMTVRREAVRFFAGVDLPDAIGAVGVSAIATENGGPEHEALHLLAASFLNAFVANFADDHGHGWTGGQRSIDDLDGVRHAEAVAVAGLQHVEVEHGWIVDTLTRARGRVDGDGVMMRIGRAHVAGQLGEAVALRVGVFLGSLGEVVGHGALAGQAPDHWIRAPAGDEVTPVLLDPGHAHARNEVSPEADNAGGQAVIGKMLDADIGHVKILGIDGGVVAIPRVAGFVGAALVEGLHVGIEAGHDLHHGETLLQAIGSEGLEAVGPAETLAQAHPPSVAEPEEGRAVGVLEVALIVGDSEHAMLVVRVVAAVSLHAQGALLIVQIGIGAVAADGANVVQARHGRVVAESPCRPAGPESGNTLFFTAGQSNDGVQIHLVKRVRVLLSAQVRPLGGLAGDSGSFIGERGRLCGCDEAGDGSRFGEGAPGNAVGHWGLSCFEVSDHPMIVQALRLCQAQNGRISMRILDVRRCGLDEDTGGRAERKLIAA